MNRYIVRIEKGPRYSNKLSVSMGRLEWPAWAWGQSGSSFPQTVQGLMRAYHAAKHSPEIKFDRAELSQKFPDLKTRLAEAE